jgi:hypothetical protein
MSNLPSEPEFEQVSRSDLEQSPFPSSQLHAVSQLVCPVSDPSNTS